MNDTILKRINDLLDLFSFFGGNYNDVENAIKKLFPNISKSEIKEIEEYLHGYYTLCMNYADILSKKYKTPFLPHGEECEKEITEYVYKCQKQYPEIDKKHIINFFSTVCWLSNR